MNSLNKTPKGIKVVPERIKERRGNLGISQTELGKRMSVTRQAISNWEGKSPYISKKHLTPLASVLSCTPDYLLGNSDMPNKYFNDGKESIFFGMPKNCIPEITEILLQYDEEKRLIIKDILQTFNSFDKTQWLLIKQMLLMFTYIKPQSPNLQIQFPLFNFHVFKMAFTNTRNELNILANNLPTMIHAPIPESLRDMENHFNSALASDFKELSSPLSSKSKFKKKLNTTSSFLDSLYEQLKELPLLAPISFKKDTLSLYDSYKYSIEKAFESDIEQTFNKYRNKT